MNKILSVLENEDFLKNYSLLHFNHEKTRQKSKNKCREIIKKLVSCFVRNCNILLLLFPFAKDFFTSFEKNASGNDSNTTEVDMSMPPTMLFFTVPSFALTITILLAVQIFMTEIGHRICKKISPGKCCQTRNQRIFCRAFDNFITVFWVLVLTAPV